MRNNTVTELYLVLWATADSPLTIKDLIRLLGLSECQVDSRVRFLHKERLVTLSGPTDEREKVKARVFPKLEVLQEKYKIRRKVEDDGGEEEMNPEDLVEMEVK